MYVDNVLTALLVVRARCFGVDDARGATATEYALLITLIAVVILTGVMLFGTDLAGMFARANSSIG